MAAVLSGGMPFGAMKRTACATTGPPASSRALRVVPGPPASSGGRDAIEGPDPPTGASPAGQVFTCRPGTDHVKKRA